MPPDLMPPEVTWVFLVWVVATGLYAAVYIDNINEPEHPLLQPVGVALILTFFLAIGRTCGSLMQ